MSGPDRDALRREQTALLAAVLHGAPAPAGFDPRRVAVQAHALVARRTAYGHRPPGRPLGWFGRLLRR